MKKKRDQWEVKGPEDIRNTEEMFDMCKLYQ